MLACNTVLLSLLDMLAIGVLTLAALGLFHQRGLPMAEAAAYALMTTLMLLSALWQLAFLINLPLAAIAGEALLACLGLFLIWRSRFVLALSWRRLWFILRIHPFFAGVFLIGLLSIGLQILRLPPPDWQAFGFWNLAPNQSRGIDIAPQSRVLPPLNTAIFLFRQVHWGACCGNGWIGLLAFGVIGLTTYALARRYAWPPTSITVAATVLCLPPMVRYVYDGGLESATAASAVFCVMLIYRLAEKPSRMDLSFLTLAILFCVTTAGLYYGLPLMLAGLALFILMRRYDLATWRDHLQKLSPVYMIYLVLGFLFSQLGIVIHNRLLAEDWFAAIGSTALHFNPNGIGGAGTNLLHYLTSILPQALAFPELLVWGLGLENQAIERLMTSPSISMLNISMDDLLAILPALSDNISHWRLGLLGTLLLPLGWLYAFWRGSRRLKTMVIWLFAYGYLLVLVPAWSSYNLAFCGPPLACGGFILAFLLPPWRFTRRGRHGILWLSAITFYASIIS